MNPWTNGQTDEATNSSKLPTVHSNASLNLPLSCHSGFVNELRDASPLFPSHLLRSSTQIPAQNRGGNGFFWKGCLSASHLHAVAGPGTLCICTGWDAEFAGGKTKPRDSRPASPAP